MTLRCLTEAPDVFKAGVSIAPVTDWDGYDTCYTERYMGTPVNNPEGYHDSSVLHAVDRLKGDLLIIHGMIDENVHFRHTARLVTALIAAEQAVPDAPAARGAALLAQGRGPEVRGRATDRVLRAALADPKRELNRQDAKSRRVGTVDAQIDET